MGYVVEKDWEHSGHRCVVIMTDRGHRCGYVGINKDHPFYGKSCNDALDVPDNVKDSLMHTETGKRGIIPLFCWDGETVSAEVLFNVHGGITYSGGNGYPVKCDLWWFGYDCNHCYDAPDLSAVSSSKLRNIMVSSVMSGTVRSLEYCIGECENLSEQLAFFEKE